MEEQLASYTIVLLFIYFSWFSHTAATSCIVSQPSSRCSSGLAMIFFSVSFLGRADLKNLQLSTAS
jgi:hypothetical protein